jgi:hypothetical protein
MNISNVYLLNTFNHRLEKKSIRALLRSLKLLFLLVVTTVCFSFSGNPTQYRTECVSLNQSDYIVLNIWHTTKCGRYKALQAEKDAIHAILFSGISGGAKCITQPPIFKSSEERENFKRIEKQFFSKSGNWAQFSRSSEINNATLAQTAYGKYKIYEVSVSKNELRKYLEEQKIIKSLTNGF